MSFYLVALFVALTPGVLLSLPKGGSKLTVAVVHAVVFAVVFQLSKKYVMQVLSRLEGFEEKKEKK